MRDEEAADQLLAFLRTSQDKASRMELALALARVVGQEFHFIQLQRAVRSEPGTAAAQAITAVKKRMVDFESVGGELTTQVDDCAEAFARGELARGATLLSRLIRMLPAHSYGETCGVILRGCAERLDEFGAARTEYLLLALHTMRVAERSDVERVSTQV
jgi:hypothetical protein